MEYLLQLGARIKNLRLLKGMTQDELAQKTGYTSRSSINKIERGLVDVPQAKIAALAKVLDVTPTFILFGKDEKTPTQVPPLSALESKLIELFRAVPDEDKEDVYKKIEFALSFIK